MYKVVTKSFPFSVWVTFIPISNSWKITVLGLFRGIFWSTHLIVFHVFDPPIAHVPSYSKEMWNTTKNAFVFLYSINSKQNMTLFGRHRSCWYFVGFSSFGFLILFVCLRRKPWIQIKFWSIQVEFAVRFFSLQSNYA